MLQNYFPILLFIIIGTAAGAGLMTLGGVFSKLLGTDKPDPEKTLPVRVWLRSFEDARIQFDVRYYLVAILFILFDLEVAFLVPWALVLKEIGSFGFFSMLIFLAILVVGFAYEWMKGALEWE